MGNLCVINPTRLSHVVGNLDSSKPSVFKGEVTSEASATLDKDLKRRRRRRKKISKWKTKRASRRRTPTLTGWIRTNRRTRLLLLKYLRKLILIP